MPIANDLPMVLEATEPERLATGFIFTEGPLWHPDGYWYRGINCRRSPAAFAARQLTYDPWSLGRSRG